jgi:hypothetical protein
MGPPEENIGHNLICLGPSLPHYENKSKLKRKNKQKNE